MPVHEPRTELQSEVPDETGARHARLRVDDDVARRDRPSGRLGLVGGERDVFREEHGATEPRDGAFPEPESALAQRLPELHELYLCVVGGVHEVQARGALDDAEPRGTGQGDGHSPGGRERVGVERARDAGPAGGIHQERVSSDPGGRPRGVTQHYSRSRDIGCREPHGDGVAVESERGGSHLLDWAQVAAEPTGEVQDGASGGCEAPSAPLRDGGMGHHFQTMRAEDETEVITKAVPRLCAECHLLGESGGIIFCVAPAKMRDQDVRGHPGERGIEARERRPPG